MEQLIKELDNLNKQIEDCNTTLKAIIQDMGRIQPMWGSESDNKNGDSNLEREQ